MAKKQNYKWIAKAMGKHGQLHEDLHVPLGTKIPLKLLQKAAKRKDEVGKRARLAITLSKFHHPSKADNAAAIAATIKRNLRAKKKA